MQAITRKWPKSRSKLSGEYLKILASTADEHREITAFLKEKERSSTRSTLLRSAPEDSHQRTTNFHGHKRHTRRSH
ncbi:hypothetical protein TNCV_2501251 [Trichonephila clavipes]|nr:hypothetical protein TNCV_2501251 [Trichonephila clavipes]